MLAYRDLMLVVRRSGCMLAIPPLLLLVKGLESGAVPEARHGSVAMNKSSTCTTAVQ